jgi:hypothetical protein
VGINKRRENVIEDIKASITLLGKVIDSVTSYGALKLSRNTMLRLYYFEVRTNLELLDVIMKKHEEHKINDPAIITMLGNMEVQTAYAILFSNDAVSRKLFKFLSSKDNVGEKDEEKDEENVKTQEKSVLKAILFTVQKIIILQKLSSFQDEQSYSILNNLRVKVRFYNIETNLQFIRKTIENLNEENKGKILGYVHEVK